MDDVAHLLRPVIRHAGFGDTGAGFGPLHRDAAEARPGPAPPRYLLPDHPDAATMERLRRVATMH
ncbi:hypothetical protein ACWDOP_28830 [Nocardia sp. NPDC003693]